MTQQRAADNGDGGLLFLMWLGQQRTNALLGAQLDQQRTAPRRIYPKDGGGEVGTIICHGTDPTEDPWPYVRSSSDGRWYSGTTAEGAYVYSDGLPAPPVTPTAPLSLGTVAYSVAWSIIPGLVVSAFAALLTVPIPDDPNAANRFPWTAFVAALAIWLLGALVLTAVVRYGGHARRLARYRRAVDEREALRRRLAEHEAAPAIA